MGLLIEEVAFIDDYGIQFKKFYFILERRIDQIPTFTWAQTIFVSPLAIRGCNDRFIGQLILFND